MTHTVKSPLIGPTYFFIMWTTLIAKDCSMHLLVCYRRVKAFLLCTCLFIY